MFSKNSHSHWPTLLVKSILLVGLLGVLFLPAPSQAKVTFDGTMGRSGSLNGPKYEIDQHWGQRHGDNLFHSFGLFDVLTGERAIFRGSDTIENIVCRVTGGNPSHIEGVLKSTIPDANLFLLNPYGVFFGPNASLDVKGSFYASTADYLRLGEHGIFYASPLKTSLLTVHPPSAFGFLSQNPAGIHVERNKLEVPERKTLSLIGGNIDLIRTSLIAKGGQIHLAGVASTGEVPLNMDNLGASAFERFGEINMSDSMISTSGESGGAVRIRGGKLVMEHSSIEAKTLGDQNGGGIGIGVTDSITMKKKSSILTNTENDGDAGNIFLKGRSLLLSDSGIGADSGGKGNAGFVDIRMTDWITQDDRSGISAATYTESKGNAGKIFIDTSKLMMSGESWIESASYGTGDGGKITIEAAELVTLRGDSFISSASEQSGRAGDLFISVPELRLVNSELFAGCEDNAVGGNIVLDGERLLLLEGGYLHTESEGSGDSGSVEITMMDRITMEGESSIWTGTGKKSSGDAGTVFISTPVLKMKGSWIDSAGYGTGSGGDVRIKAEESVTLGEGSFIISQSFQSGRAGDIFISAPVFTMKGSWIESIGYGKSDGGDVTIKAEESVTIKESWIGSESLERGRVGDIFISAPELCLVDSGLLAPSRGDAVGGNIKITSNNLYLENSSITCEAEQSNGGNISIFSEHVLLLEDSSIEADAEGDGGTITISAQVVLRDPSSWISASSDRGIDGTIDIRTPISNISGILKPLPQEFESATELLRESCRARLLGGEYSSFILSGLDGLPIEPGGLMPSPLLE